MNRYLLFNFYKTRNMMFFLRCWGLTQYSVGCWHYSWYIYGMFFVLLMWWKSLYLWFIFKSLKTDKLYTLLSILLKWLPRFYWFCWLCSFEFLFTLTQINLIYFRFIPSSPLSAHLAFQIKIESSQICMVNKIGV